MATVVLSGIKVTANNTYKLKPGNGNQRTLAVSGTFDGAILTPGYINADGIFIGFKDETETVITFTASFQIVQGGGIGMKYALLVASAGASTDMLVEQFDHGR